MPPVRTTHDQPSLGRPPTHWMVRLTSNTNNDSRLNDIYSDLVSSNFGDPFNTSSVDSSANFTLDNVLPNNNPFVEAFQDDESQDPLCAFDLDSDLTDFLNLPGQLEFSTDASGPSMLPSLEPPSIGDVADFLATLSPPVHETSVTTSAPLPPRASAQIPALTSASSSGTSSADPITPPPSSLARQRRRKGKKREGRLADALELGDSQRVAWSSSSSSHPEGTSRAVSTSGNQSDAYSHDWQAYGDVFEQGSSSRTYGAYQGMQSGTILPSLTSPSFGANAQEYSGGWYGQQPNLSPNNHDLHPDNYHHHLWAALTTTQQTQIIEPTDAELSATHHSQNVQQLLQVVDAGPSARQTSGGVQRSQRSAHRAQPYMAHHHARTSGMASSHASSFASQAPAPPPYPPYLSSPLYAPYTPYSQYPPVSPAFPSHLTASSLSTSYGDAYQQQPTPYLAHFHPNAPPTYSMASASASSSAVTLDDIPAVQPVQKGKESKKGKKERKEKKGKKGKKGKASKERFPCPVCSETCGRSAELQRHVEITMDEDEAHLEMARSPAWRIRFPNMLSPQLCWCPVCGYWPNRKDALKRHMETQHKEE
ncbi:hypothetical protein OF83DRAFT_1205010 [Amylostereum chailletii]|nr:hypothetical protein OF83DRAFT_1205010 [Amylostereum chailletii]